MSRKSEVGLISFFIFNSSFGPREGEEHKKILYYYPPQASIDTKIRQIGLCEAVIKFTRTFTEHASESLHTQQTRQLFYEPEPDFWIVMTVKVPMDQSASDGSQSVDSYLDEDVQDHVYQAVLRQSYNIFRLFNGSIRHILSTSAVEGLKQHLEFFFNKYLINLKLSSCDILDVFNGIHFLPLDKNTYLRLQCFLNQLEMSIPEISYSVFLYGDQLVWSGLEQEDIRILYSYLTENLFPAVQEQDVISAPATTNRFLLPPPDATPECMISRIPRVHLINTDETEEYSLIVYRVLSASICLLVQGDFIMTNELLKKIESHLELHMTAIATDIADHTSSKKAPSSTEPQFRYVYFNHMNLAQKSSLHVGTGRHLLMGVPVETLRLLADVNHDLNAIPLLDDGELIIKTANDFWVVGKKCDQREVYIIVNQKNASLVEINEEVKKLCSAHFGNIFFLD